MNIEIIDKDKIQDIIGGMSKGKLQYETKKATKKGFDTIEEYIQSGLNALNQNNKGERTSPNTQFNLRELKDAIDNEKKVIAIQNAWKKERGGKPYFDSTYYIGVVKSNNREGLPLTSEEMVIHFLKTIGNINPNLVLPNENDVKNPMASGYYKFTFRLLMGIGEIVKGKLNDISPDFVKPEGIKNFCKHHKLIKNDKMFWALFEYLWCNNSTYFTEDMFNYSKRSEVPVKERMQLGYRIFDFMNKFNDDRLYKPYLLSRYDEIRSNEYISMYRLFRVKQGQKIRTGKKGSADWSKHYEGNSWSYSFSKQSAIYFGGNPNVYMYKKHANLNDEDAVKRYQEQVKGSVKETDATFYDGYYTCIGHFWCKKKDIEYNTDSFGEDEVVVNPKNVILHEYRFLNMVDIIATDEFVHYLGVISQNEKDKFDAHSTYIINKTELFDVVYMYVKRFLDKNPSYIKKYLLDDVRNKDKMKIFRSMVEFFKESFGSEPKYFSAIIEEFPSLNQKFVELVVAGKDWSYYFPRHHKESSIRQRKTLSKKQIEIQGGVFNKTGVGYYDVKKYQQDYPSHTKDEFLKWFLNQHKKKTNPKKLYPFKMFGVSNHKPSNYGF